MTPLRIMAIDGGATGAACIIEQRSEGRPVLLGLERLRAPEAIAAALQRLFAIVAPTDIEQVLLEAALSVDSDAGYLRRAGVYHGNVGAVRGALGALGVVPTLVGATRWQRDMGFAIHWHSRRRSAATVDRGALKRAILADIKIRVDFNGHKVPQYAADAVAIAVWGLTEHRVYGRQAR